MGKHLVYSAVEKSLVIAPRRIMRVLWVNEAGCWNVTVPSIGYSLRVYRSAAHSFSQQVEWGIWNTRDIKGYYVIRLFSSFEAGADESKTSTACVKASAPTPTRLGLH